MPTSNLSQSGRVVGLSLLGILGGCAAFEAAENVKEVTGVIASSLKMLDTNGDGVIAFEEICFWMFGANVFVWAEARGRWFGKGARATKNVTAKVVRKITQKVKRGMSSWSVSVQG